MKITFTSFRHQLKMRPGRAVDRGK